MGDRRVVKLALVIPANVAWVVTANPAARAVLLAASMVVSLLACGSPVEGAQMLALAWRRHCARRPAYRPMVTFGNGFVTPGTPFALPSARARQPYTYGR